MCSASSWDGCQKPPTDLTDNLGPIQEPGSTFEEARRNLGAVRRAGTGVNS